VSGGNLPRGRKPTRKIAEYVGRCPCGSLQYVTRDAAKIAGRNATGHAPIAFPCRGHWHWRSVTVDAR
jgi:hypothetical protein